MTHSPTVDELRVRIAALERVADRVVAMTLTHPDGEPMPEWEPGAHIDVLLENDIVRQYSLCGDPSDRSCLQIAVLRENESRGGSRLIHDDLRVGDLLGISGPRNNFELVDADHYLFIAGGIGITPILPMVAREEKAGADWHLLYGGRSDKAMAFTDELREQYGDRVTVRPEDEYGLLDLAGALDAAEPGTAVYCCGPVPLIEAVTEQCAQRESLDLHVEYFRSTLTESDKTGDSFQVVLATSGREISVAPDETTLDALLREGLDVDFSCKEGTCGTCEQVVLDGVPDHRDLVLTEDEQAENDCMMVCVSRSLSARLTLDL